MARKNADGSTAATLIVAVIALLLGIGGGYGYAVSTLRPDDGSSFPQVGIGGGPLEGTDTEVAISGWPQSPRETARALIEQYGQPQEKTTSQLIWFDKGGWKRIAINKDPILSVFPTPHEAFLEQTVNYAVPSDAMDEISAFNGGITASVLKGELTVTSDTQAMNYLAVNLANDIIAKGKTVDDAKNEYVDTAQQLKNGQSPPNTQQLEFLSMPKQQ